MNEQENEILDGLLAFRTLGLDASPTLCVGQSCDLKYEGGGYRVWLSRCGIDDGEPFENTITIEHLDARGHWIEIVRYDGDAR